MALRGTTGLPNQELDTRTTGQVYEGPAPLVDASALGETSVHDEASPNEVAQPDAVQTVTITNGSSGDTFTLTVAYPISGDEETTDDIAYNAAASAVEAALEALDGIEDGDFVVTGSNGGPFTVTAQATGNFPPLSVDVPAITGEGTGCDVAVVGTGL